tara:strand:+ start:1289 stop:1489 length:201 start_codon:yes stop_codon:yes gene_type:complete
MAGNRFNRMPIANMMTNAKQDLQIRALYQDLNRLASSVEQELLKIDKVVSEDDMIDSSSQLTWFLE